MGKLRADGAARFFAKLRFFGFPNRFPFREGALPSNHLQFAPKPGAPPSPLRERDRRCLTFAPANVKDALSYWPRRMPVWNWIDSKETNELTPSRPARRGATDTLLRVLTAGCREPLVPEPSGQGAALHSPKSFALWTLILRMRRWRSSRPCGPAAASYKKRLRGSIPRSRLVLCRSLRRFPACAYLAQPARLPLRERARPAMASVSRALPSR